MTLLYDIGSLILLIIFHVSFIYINMKYSEGSYKKLKAYIDDSLEKLRQQIYDTIGMKRNEK